MKRRIHTICTGGVLGAFLGLPLNWVLYHQHQFPWGVFVVGVITWTGMVLSR